MMASTFYQSLSTNRHLFRSNLGYSVSQDYQCQHPQLLMTYRKITNDAFLPTFINKVCSLANEEDGGYAYICHSKNGSRIIQGINVITETMVQNIRDQVLSSIKILDPSQKKLLTKVDCLRFLDRQEYLIRISIWPAPGARQCFYATQKQNGKTIYQIYSVAKVNNQPIAGKVEGEDIYHLMLRVAKWRRERKAKISQHSRFRHEITISQAKQDYS